MRILYVEQESTTREFILEVIQQDHIEVEVCTSAAEALQFLDFEVYDLIITEFRLPQNGGVNILRKLIKNKQFPKLIYFSSVRPRKSRNLKKLIKRQNIFYVPRGMTAVSIDGLSKHIANFQVGFYQRMFEALMAKKSSVMNDKRKKKQVKQPAENEKAKVKSLLDVDVEDDGIEFGNDVGDFGLLDLGDQEEQTETANWDFEPTRSQEEMEADWELFQKKGFQFQEEDYGFEEKQYQEETEADWGTIESNVLKDLDDLDEDESDWLTVSEEVDADWDLGNEKSGAVDADWKIEKNQTGDEQADWSLEKNKLADEEADWSANKEKPEDETADWSTDIENQSATEEDEELVATKSESLDPNDKFKEYIGIPLNRLKILKSTPCDIFIKLGQRKMLKMINQEDEVGSDFFDNMQDKGATEMFLKKTQFEKFDEVFGKILDKQLKSSKIHPNEKVQIMGSQLGFDYVRNQMQAIGISDSTARMAESTVQNTMSMILKDKSLYGLLKDILTGKSYISEHSLMAVTISIEMIKRLGWNTGDTNEKVTMAGLFHDSLLSDERLARINRVSQLKDLNQVEKDIVLNHADEAARVLEKSKFVSQDVYNIVKQHHERPQGEGFPNGIQPQAISNLSCVFILAEELVELLYTYKFDAVKVRQCWESDFEFFNIGNFKKPLEVSKDIL